MTDETKTNDELVDQFREIIREFDRASYLDKGALVPELNAARATVLARMVNVPPELRQVVACASEGRWSGGHMCDGSIRVGHPGGREAIGSDLPANDATAAAACVNFVRAFCG